MTMAFINGVPSELYGLWCQHGKRLLVPDPADVSPYPCCIPADPWPCAELTCTLDAIEQQMLEQQAEELT